MLYSNRALAQELTENVQARFWDAQADFLLEMFPPKPGAEKYSFLWGYGALCTMLATYLKNTRDRAKLPFLYKVVEKLELYSAKRGGYTYYDSHPDCFGAGEPYYDDNAWVVLALLDVYGISGDKAYLLRAQAVAEYLYSGWSNGVGGIRWKEADCVSSHTCSCGPTAVASCKLYALTGEKKYLDWAKKIYEWTCKTLEDADGTFFDNINESGVVDKRKYTYNTGTMIWSGVLLYELTGEARYLKKAEHSASGAMKCFVRKDANQNVVLPPTPWFHVYWLQGLTALHAHTDMSSCISVIEKVLREASCVGRTESDFYYPEWSDAAYTGGTYYHQGLDNFGTAECFALLVPYEEQSRPVYCFLGSSVTYGCGEHGKSFVEVFARGQAFPCVKEAVSGTTLCALGKDSYVARLREMDTRCKVKHLVVQLSTNDISQNMPLGSVGDSKNIEDFDGNTTLGAIETIIAYAKKTWDCGVTFFTNPPYGNAAYERLVEKLYSLQKKWGFGILDFYHFRDMPTPDKATFASYMADAIHPNEAGYAWMGDIFRRYLQNA